MSLESLQLYHIALIEFHERRLVEIEVQLKKTKSNRRKRLLKNKINYHSDELERLREKLAEEQERKRITKYRRRGRILTRHTEVEDD